MGTTFRLLPGIFDVVPLPGFAVDWWKEKNETHPRKPEVRAPRIILALCVWATAKQNQEPHT
jgi:hypothetical protein